MCGVTGLHERLHGRYYGASCGNVFSGITLPCGITLFLITLVQAFYPILAAVTLSFTLLPDTFYVRYNGDMRR